MYNRVILLGNLTRDIELKYTQNGLAIAKTAIATNRKYKTQTGEQKQEVCFIDITLFGRAAEVANQYLSKGRQVLVEGRLVFEQWVDANGQKRSKHSVAVENMQMLGNRGDNMSDKNSTYQPYSKPEPSPSYSKPEYQEPKKENKPKADIPEYDIDDDEIPF